MPLTGYLKIPDIDGHSQANGHESEIEIQGFDWGVEGAKEQQSGRGRRRSRSSVEEIVFEKYTDSATPYLFLAAAQGKSFDEIVFTVRKDSGEAHLDYLTITLKNAIISDFTIFNDREGTSLDICETVSIKAETVGIKYVTISADGSAGDEHEIEYDVVAGA